MGYTITDRELGRELTLDEVLDMIEQLKTIKEYASFMRVSLDRDIKLRQDQLAETDFDFDAGYISGLSFALLAFQSIR